MESTKGKMNMHFETITKDQTCNADRRMPTVKAHCHYLPQLPSNPQGQTRRLLPHVGLKTPYAQTPHPLNQLNFITPRRERRRNQDFRLPTVNTPWHNY